MNQSQGTAANGPDADSRRDSFQLDIAGDDGMPAGFLLERAAILKDVTLDLVGQLERRGRIHDANLHRLNCEQCEVRSGLLQLPHVFIGSNPDIDRARTQLGTEHQRLELEKNREESAHWKDAAPLHADLAKWLQEYRMLIEKLEILTGRPQPRPTIADLLAPPMPVSEGGAASGSIHPGPFMLRQLTRIP